MVLPNKARVYRRRSPTELEGKSLNIDRLPRSRKLGATQALEELISTMRIASIRGFGGSAPNRAGGSPLSTQRQNFRSAVTIRCW